MAGFGCHKRFPLHSQAVGRSAEAGETSEASRRRTLGGMLHAFVHDVDEFLLGLDGQLLIDMHDVGARGAVGDDQRL